MRKSVWLPLIIFIVLLTACSNSGGTALTEGITFRSVDEIIEGPLEVANFASDGSATLPIHTTVPVACTVVYGTTPEFGSLTLDQDMAGGTHSDHNPLLSGLEPETTYYFRVQGVDDDGNIYLSEVMTFTAPPLDDAPTENLASPLQGAEITEYSSAFGGAAPDERWGAKSAFDDNPNTEWSSAGDGDDAWIEIKLAQPARVDTVSFHSRAMPDGSAITLAFTVTTDNGEVVGPFDVPNTSQPFEFELAFEAQTLRFDLVDTTGGNTGVVDIAVFGTLIE
ncbi:MAG: discoidin domain-containing protein [Anaerolineales bacterium]